MPPWLSSMFVHPELVIPGLALVSLPLIIHLINRLRYRRVKWAAMEFLLASQQRNKRRVLLEQLLLLLLRMIAVAALVMLVARPLIDPERFALFQANKTQHVVLVDDSGSMRDRWGDATAFDAAREVLRRIADEGSHKPDTQTLTVLLASNPEQPLVNQQNLNADFVAGLDSVLKGMICSHQALDLAQGVEACRRLLAEHPAGARNFHLVSDFREHDWGSDAALAEVIRQMAAEKISVNLVKTVPESHGNLGITELSGAIEVAAANVPLRLSATVRNFGQQPARDVRLSVLVDGKRLPAAELYSIVEPGREATREFDVVFPAVGPHRVEVILPADALEQDNHRYLSLDVPEANPVLIIDGSPSNSEAFYLADALAPTPGITGFAPSIETVEYLRRRPIDRFQSIFLLNVGELPADVVRTLEQYVSFGGGLGWYLGDQVRAVFYNDRLYRAGQGLFPATLAAVAELPVDDTSPGADVIFDPHPIARIFEGEKNPFLDLVKVNRYFAVRPDWTAADGTRVIARLRNKAPLLIEHRLGKGTILTCLTSLGTTWNNLPLEPPVFVSMQLETARYLARSDRQDERKIVGEPLLISLDAAGWSPTVEIVPPDGSRVPLTLGTRAVDANASAPGAIASASTAFYEDVYRRTGEPGVYAMQLKRQDGGEEVRRIAFNVPTSESELELATDEAIAARIGPGTSVAIQSAGDFGWVHAEETGREVHDYVLMGLLVLLLCEQLLSLKLGYHPKPARVAA